MDKIFLDVYFGQQIAENTINQSWLQTLNEFSTYIFLFLFFILIMFLAAYLMPVLFRNPKSYFKRYKIIREEMSKIDQLYSKKEISFEEYSFAQFNYAKEYENIVLYLSKYPEYKVQLQSYKIKEVENRETENKSSKLEKSKLNTIDFLFDLLRSHAKYYTKEEIEQAILDEGFTKDIAMSVLEKMENHNLPFASETKMEQNKIINIINSLLSKNYENPPVKGEASTINLGDLSKKKKNVFEEEKVSFNKYPSVKKEETKKGLFESIKNAFKSKPKTHTVSEINDIFVEIEKRLKENN